MQQVRDYKRITVEPIGGVIGAEIGGVDLAKLDDETFAEIRQAFADHLAIFFKGQKLEALEFQAFGARFGQLSITSYVPPLHGTMQSQRPSRDRYCSISATNSARRASQSMARLSSALWHALQTPPASKTTRGRVSGMMHRVQ